MGQRLNIEIVKNDKLLANSYYHWSGYSDCAINLAIKIINNFDYIKKYKVENVTDKDMLFAIRLLEETGAGTNESEMKGTIEKIGLIDENVVLKECRGRDEGIIEISEEGMGENRYWEEARVTIDIENKTIDFDVIHEINKEDYDKDELKDMSFKEIYRNFKKVKFEDVFELKAFIDEANYNKQFYFFNKMDNKNIELMQ